LIRFKYILLALLVWLSFTPPSVAVEVISAITFTGLERSQPRMLLRELPFGIGDEWSAAGGAEADRRLRNLGLFSVVSVSPPDAAGVVAIYVKERWSLYLLPEGSRSDVGKTSAGLTLTEHNMWGLNHRLRIAGREDTGKNFSGLNGTRLDASYNWNRVNDGPVSLSFGVGGGRSVFDTFDLGVLTGQYRQEGRSWFTAVDWSLDEVPGDGWDLGLGFYSNRATFYLVSGLPSGSVRDRQRNSLLAKVSYNKLDDHTNWITGQRFNYALDIAHQSLGSTIDVYRQTLSFSVQKALDDSHTTLGMRLSAGGAAGEVLQDGIFDIGNNGGLRGYLPGELQGEYYVFANLEARFLLKQDKRFQFVVFTDAGQIWSRQRPAYGQALIAGAGGGLRFTLNWLVNGTFRTDVAYGLASKRWRFYFGTGQAF